MVEVNPLPERPNGIDVLASIIIDGGPEKFSQPDKEQLAKALGNNVTLQFLQAAA